MSRASSQITDGKVETDTCSNLCTTESSESESLANSLTPDLNAPSDKSSLVTNNDTGVKLGSASNNELSLQALGVGEHGSEMLVQNAGESTKDIGADMVKDVSMRTSHSLGSEGGTKHDHMSRLADTLSIPASVTAPEEKAFRVKRKDGGGEESVHVSEDIPNTSLTQSIDQVTDVGCALLCLPLSLSH